MKYTILSIIGEKSIKGLSKKELLAISFIPLMILLIIFLSLISFNRMKEFEQKVDRTNSVIRNYDLLFLTVRDLGSYERSYAFSGDSVFLKSYHSSVDSTQSIISRLGTLLNDNPSQTASLNELKLSVNERIGILNKD